jgi:hypothetical protein
MRRCLVGLGLLLPMFLGCSGENIVAGEGKTKAQQLESALPTWCPSTCDRLRACPEDATCECSVDQPCDSCVAVDNNCEAQCQQAFVPYTGAGETCAAIGQRIKNCIDRIMCADLGGSDPCVASEAELALCPDPNADSGDTAAAASSYSGPSSGGTTSTGPGSAGPNGGSYPLPNGGSNSGANPVNCLESSGSGGGMPASGGAYVSCEENRSACTDGHTYNWICAQDSQGQRACTCLVDSQATAGFVPISSDCPPLSQVNAGCAWALTQ